jgi:hypothetical protein
MCILHLASTSEIHMPMLSLPGIQPVNPGLFGEIKNPDRFFSLSIQRNLCQRYS